MGALALEVNDAGLLALRAGSPRPERESPGLALLDGGKLLVGAEAAAQAHRAMQGDLSGVTQGLGTAFNSTLVALLLSLFLMFLLHHLQTDQERLVRDAETYLDERLIQSLRAA